MLGNTNRIESQPAECKVDPEEQLQRARKKKERIEKDIAAFNEFGDYYFHDSERLSQMLYGVMHYELKMANDNIERWLKEIDNA